MLLLLAPGASTLSAHLYPRSRADPKDIVQELAPAIHARGLEKRYGNVQALTGLDVVVPRGSAFGLIGENGAGKTTFIKLLLGIAHPSRGEVSVLGGQPRDVAVRRRIGYLPERLELPPAYTPVRFLTSVGKLKGLKKRELDDQVPRVLSQVGLAESAWQRRTRGFSKGMRQRTGLAAALLGKPDLLVLDEPTDGIDPVGRAHIRQVIKQAKQDGTTVFLNSHLLAETERICDHVAIVSKGRVVRAGSLESLRAESAFRVTFQALDGLEDKAARHGFVPDVEARKAGPAAAFRLEAASAEALSAALQGALADGLVVVEVVKALRDLESVLAEVMREGAGASRSETGS